MTAVSQRLAVGQPFATGSLRLLAPLAALHGAMFLFDLAHPDRYLNADRASERLQAIDGFSSALRAGDALAYTAAHGNPGDWLPQALVYLAGGPYLVITVQVLLTLASVLWVRELGIRLRLGEGKASLAAALYALLPHTLVFPHQLTSEAFFVPLVVLAFRYSLPQLGGRAGTALGFATLVRPVTLAWPFVAAAIQRAPNSRRAVFVASALAPVLVWMSFVCATTGQFSLGASSHDLGANLYYRMQRIGATLPEPQRPPEKPEGEHKASIGEYLRFGLAHPAAVTAHHARDLVVIVFKSGIERLTLDYLDLFPESRKALQQSDGGWRSSLEQQGAEATFTQLLRAHAGLVLSSVAGAIAFTLLLAIALHGAIVSRGRPNWLLLSVFVVYVAATAQAVDAAQSRHRAPAEFALCLLAVLGWSTLSMREKRRRGR